MQRRLGLSLFIIFIVLLFTMSPLYAGIRGKMKGTVKTSDGKPLEGVDITIESLRVANERYEIKTDKDGSFVYIGMKPYKYKIIVEKEGYQTYIEPEFKIRAGVWVELDVILNSNEEVKEMKFESLSPEKKADFTYNKALDAFAMDKLDETVAALKEAIDYNPNFLKAYNLLGILYYTKLDDKAKAQEAFEGALAADETDTTAYEYLGAIADKKGESDKAADYWKKYFDLGGDSAVVAENLAVIYMKKDDNKSARTFLEKGIEVQDDFPPLYKKLGDVCMRLQDFPASISAYKTYLELDPDAPEKNLVTVLITELEKAEKKKAGTE